MNLWVDPRSAAVTRAAGIALFLPVPIVLFLFTQAPLGVYASLGPGTLLMATHRRYARPFALRHAAARCLWCGRSAPAGPSFPVEDPLGTATWRACGADHAGRVARVLAWAGRRALPLRVGILGTLVVFLVGAPLAASGRAGGLGYADLVAFFRFGIAATVLPLGFVVPWSAAPVEGALRPPFPVHIQALIGTSAVLWLFRLIGLAWLTLALLHVADRLGIAL